ncbi:MAG: RteC domain-containing protein [Prevotella sp.]|nr:RteC domain-containing protein [Prevotella sp.]
MNTFPASREKNALTTAFKSMYLLELGMQVLEWRINAPDSKPKSVSESKYPFPGNKLLALYKRRNLADTEEEALLSLPKVRLTWTGSKVELVELIYALDAAGCFNHGHATIKEIVVCIEVMLNVDLGDYYHTFMEIRNRKNSTAFLDRLIKVLNDRMEEADRKK